MYGFKTVLLIVILAVAGGFSGCSETSSARSQANTARPLVTPEAVSTAPKIVAFGDSLTAGFGLAEPESYPYLLQKKLKAAGYNYEPRRD